MNNEAQTGGVGLGSLLFLVFLVLKLTGHISWSWWWVTAPLWLPFAVSGFIFMVVLTITLAMDKY